MSKEVDIAKEKPIRVSISALAKKDRALLGKPISYLAKKSGLSVSTVYEKLLPALDSGDLYERLQYADIGLKYAEMVDRNRLRDEVGEEFILALDKIFYLIYEGIRNEKNQSHVLKKAMLLNCKVLDEFSEKKRFIETVLQESKIEEISKSLAACHALDLEIQLGKQLALEADNNGKGKHDA